METMYLNVERFRKKVFHYEMLKHTEKYPHHWGNTFLSLRWGSPTVTPGEVDPSNTSEKEAQIKTLKKP